MSEMGTMTEEGTLRNSAMGCLNGSGVRQIKPRLDNDLKLLSPVVIQFVLAQRL